MIEEESMGYDYKLLSDDDRTKMLLNGLAQLEKLYFETELNISITSEDEPVQLESGETMTLGQRSRSLEGQMQKLRTRYADLLNAEPKS